MKKVYLIFALFLATAAMAQQLGAILPQTFTQQVCDPTSSTVYNTTAVGYSSGTTTLGSGTYPDTIAGLIAAANAWAADGNSASWGHLLVPTGQSNMLHGGTGSFDSNNALWTWPLKAGATGCLVVDPVDYSALPIGQTICGRTIQGRNPGCTTDIGKLWTLRIDSAPQSGYHAIFACGGNTVTYGNPSCSSGMPSDVPTPMNHILVRGAEVTVAPGAFQSQAGVNAAELISVKGGPSNLGIEYSYIHGWDPGDTGQPSGACASWTLTGTVTTTLNPPGFSGDTLITQASGAFFGPQLRSGSIVTINGTNFSVVDDGTYLEGLDNGTQNTQFIVSGLVPSSGSYSFSESNVYPSQYANGCGDDVVSGIGFDGSGYLLFNYVEKIHWWGSESHAVSYGFVTGLCPKIAHNHFEGGSIPIFNGGSAVDTNGGPCTDGEIRGNWFGHDLNWRYLSAGAGNSPPPPFGAGPIGSCSSGCPAQSTAPMSWAIKNCFELKLGVRMLIDGNIFDGCWSDGQNGYLFLSNPRVTSGGTAAGVFNPSTGLPLTQISNETITNNVFTDAPQGIQFGALSLTPGNGGGVGIPLDFLTIGNNTFVIGDQNQWGAPGNTLIELGGSGANEFAAVMSRNGSGVATAAASPIQLASCTAGSSGCPPVPACGANCGLVNSAIVISKVVVSGTSPNYTVTINFNSKREDPVVGGNLVVWGPGPWTGTFAITGVFNTGVNTLCSSPDNSQPQPCIRSDGTFGDSASYTMSSPPSTGPICASVAACGTDGWNVVIPTHAYQIVDIPAGGGIFLSNCTGGTNPSAYEVGGTSATYTQAIAPTVAAGLNVYFNNAGPADSSGTICQLQNGQGHPYGVLYENNTVLTLNYGMSIGAGGTDRQLYNHTFTHNVFVAPSATSPLGWTCASVGAEGNNSFLDCWGQGSTGLLTQFDNLIANQSGSAPTVLSNYTDVWLAGVLNPGSGTTPNYSPNVNCPGAPTAACLGWTGWTVTGGLGLSYPTGYCPPANAPFNCPLMGEPWSSNFAITYLSPIAGSSYSAQAVNVSKTQTAQTQLIYVCPASVPCGTPFPDVPTVPVRPPSSPIPRIFTRVVNGEIYDNIDNGGGQF
jgi:hypothetical protein